MAPQPFAAIRAAVIDERTRNVIYRQTQLEKLFRGLVKNASEIQEAIVADTGVLAAEAKIEYTLALNTLRERYAELDPKKDLEEEYAIAHRKDAGGARVGAGVVVIQPSTFTLFYSIIAPLSAALAAGNCVVVQLENNLRQLGQVLRRVLKTSLDQDTFAIADSPIEDGVFGLSCVQVVQNGSLEGDNDSNQIVSIPSSTTLAIVDRQADFDEAARALVKARFAFGGKSPYAPDVIFVNEYTKKDFLQALVRQAIGALDGGEIVLNGSAEKSKSRENGLKSFIADLQKESGVRLISQEANGAIIDLQTRSPQLVQKKVTEPCVMVHSIKSLDDVIDFVNANSKTVLAAYHFGTPDVCKYLSQFIPAQVSFVNHIPAEILVGPAFPLNHAVTPSTRYPTTLFTKPAPAYINPSSTSKTLAAASTTAEKTKALQKLYLEAVSDLPVVRKRQKQATVGFGFFEHAFVAHFGLYVLSTIGAIGTTIWWVRSGRGVPFTNGKGLAFFKR